MIRPTRTGGFCLYRSPVFGVGSRPVNRTTFATLLLLLGLGSIASFAGCNGSAIQGQGEGCMKTSDCPTGNNLVCTPLKNGGGGTCQILCMATGPACPNNEACEIIEAAFVPVCVFKQSGSGGSGVTGTSTGTTSTTTAATTSTGG
jgi:hypothetical protein